MLIRIIMSNQISITRTWKYKQTITVIGARVAPVTVIIPKGFRFYIQIEQSCRVYWSVSVWVSGPAKRGDIRLTVSSTEVMLGSCTHRHTITHLLKSQSFQMNFLQGSKEQSLLLDSWCDSLHPPQWDFPNGITSSFIQQITPPPI